MWSSRRPHAFALSSTDLPQRTYGRSAISGKSGIDETFGKSRDPFARFRRLHLILGAKLFRNGVQMRSATSLSAKKRPVSMSISISSSSTGLASYRSVIFESFFSGTSRHMPKPVPQSKAYAKQRELPAGHLASRSVGNISARDRPEKSGPDAAHTKTPAAKPGRV